MKLIIGIIYLLFFAFLVPYSTNAQFQIEYCNEVKGRRTISNFERAIDLLNQRKLDEAEELLVSILNNEETFTEGWIALSEIYYTRFLNASNRNAADRFYRQYMDCVFKIDETCPSFNNYEAKFIIASYFLETDEREKAKETFKAYLEKGDKNSVVYKNAKDKYDYLVKYFELINNPVPFEPHLVRGVSTVDDEYLPLISPDGTMAFFTKAYMKRQIGSIYNEQFVEEFTVAYSLDDEGLVFTKGEPMPYPFNQGLNQGAATITIDNRTMYITICQFVSRDYESCNIYMTENRNNRWTELRDLGPNINGRFTWESQPSISADGNTIYFASIRESNIGFNPYRPTSDIYYAVKDENGNWGQAKNMGPVINTSGNEKTPFIHSDSQTLYFASDGHPGIGGYDIFYSQFRDGEWTKPVNLGYPINTPYDDLSLIVSTQGDKAYFASNKLKGKGGWDIYAFELYEEARPERVFFASGQILDEHGYGMSEARLEVRNTRTNQINTGMVSSEDGNYAIAVTIDKEEEDDFLMVVKREGYLYTSKLINPIEDNISAPMNLNFEVKPIEVGQVMQLNDIYFATASYSIDNKSLAVLDAFIEFLIENPFIRLKLSGHTDSIGDFDLNMRLSENRAKAVYDYLISKGIQPGRLQYKGFGDTKPVDTNETAEGRARNRRTEFKIIGR